MSVDPLSPPRLHSDLLSVFLFCLRARVSRIGHEHRLHHRPGRRLWLGRLGRDALRPLKEKKRKETKRNETKRNETKRNEDKTRQDQTRPDPCAHIRTPTRYKALRCASCHRLRYATRAAQSNHGEMMMMMMMTTIVRVRHDDCDDDC